MVSGPRTALPVAATFPLDSTVALARVSVPEGFGVKAGEHHAASVRVFVDPATHAKRAHERCPSA
jgi:hypothetical protein